MMAQLTAEEVDRLAFEAYRSHGWPMDPAKFLTNALILLGYTITEGR